LAELPLDALNPGERDLGANAVEVELFADRVLGRLVSAQRIDSTDSRSDLVEQLQRWNLVDIEEEVDVGEAISASAACRSRKQCGPNGSQLHRGIDHTARELAQVLAFLVRGHRPMLCGRRFRLRILCRQATNAHPGGANRIWLDY